MRTRLLTVFLIHILGILTLAMTLNLPAALAQNQHLIDSLSLSLSESIHDTVRVNTLNELSWQLKYINVDTAIELASKALSISEKRSWEHGLAKSHDRLGTVNLVKGNFIEASHHYQKAIAKYEEQGRSRNYITTLGNLGIVYKEQGDHPRALEYYYKSLAMNEETENRQGTASNLNNIGLIYWLEDQYEKAIENYLRALEINLKRGHKTGIANQYANLGLIYENMEEYEKSLDYHFKSIALNEELGQKNGVATVLSNVGLVYKRQRDFDKALKHYSLALQMQEEVGDRNEVARISGLLGETYTLIGKFKKAEITLQKAIEFSKDIRSKTHLMNQYRFLSELYDTTARPGLAFQAYKLHIIYRDSISNEENTKAVTRTEMKYEYEKAELIEQQEEKEAARLQAEETSRRDNLQYSVILIALLVFGILLSVIGRFSIPIRVVEGLIFFSFLILFEFILVLADPYIDTWSSGAPGIKLLFNAGIAALIFPIHAFFETRLKLKLSR